MEEGVGDLRGWDCPLECRGEEGAVVRGQGDRRGSRRPGPLPPDPPCHRGPTAGGQQTGPCPQCCLWSQTSRSCRCTCWRPTPVWPPWPQAGREQGRWQRDQSQGKTLQEDSDSPSSELHLETVIVSILSIQNDFILQEKHHVTGSI